jgi:hypothetical protein
LKSPLDQIEWGFLYSENAEACFKVFSECKNQLGDRGAEQDFKSLSFLQKRITETTKEVKVNPFSKKMSFYAVSIQARLRSDNENKNQLGDRGAEQDFKSLS